MARDAYYKQLFEAAAVGLSVSTRGGRLLDANDTLGRMFGYENGEAMLAEIGADVRAQFVDPSPRDRAVEAIEAGARSAVAIGQFRRRDGAPLWIRSVMSRAHDSPAVEPTFLSVVMDVSDLVEALRAMEITEVGFRSWFDNAREGIFRSSADGRLLRANRALARLNGYDTPEELIAAVRDIAAEWYVDPQRRAEYLALIERDGEVVAFESEIWRHRTRERIWVSENSRAVRDLDGSILYLEGTVVEITNRVRAEAHLQEARRQAEQASRAKTLFLANISHELRTPLNAIMGFSEIIRDRIFGEGAGERYSGYAADIHTSASHLLQLINDILDITKAEAGHIELDEDVVDLASVVEAALRLLGPKVREGVITLETVVEADLPFVRGDPKRLRQVLLNMMSNAMKFTAPGGRVRLEARRRPGGVEVAVSDTGIGIDPQDLGRIFEPFYQTERGRDRNVEGTGLGLPISRRLIEMHGGRMDVASAPGRGTRIAFFLPDSRIVGPGEDIL
jgi:PAS domain S-box-containing protein